MRVVHSLYVKDNKILLLFKESRQKWFLPGGKSEFGENVIETGCREFYEETGLKLLNAELGAVTTIVIEEMHQEWMLYTVKGIDAQGSLLKRTREGELQLHPITDIDELPMFDGDRLIIKELLKGDLLRPFVSTQYYTPTYELKKIKD